MVLRRYFHDDFFKISNVSLKPYSNDVDGFLGVHMLLKIEVERENETRILRFFVKSPPINNEAFLDLALTSNSFGKEIFVYTDFCEKAKELLLRVDSDFLPKFFFASNDLIILEDLTEKGFVAKGDKIEKAHVELALEKLAKFHSISLGIEEYQTRKQGAPYNLRDDYKDLLSEALFPEDENLIAYKYNVTSMKAIHYLIEFLPKHKISTDMFRRGFEEEIEGFFAVFNEDNHFRKVCCHGDLWRNNMMFKYEKGNLLDCVFVDFQLNRYAPPAHDVTFLIYQISDKNLFRKHYQHFLDKYYQCLTEELLKIDLDITDVLPLQEFEETCKLHLRITKLIKAFYSTMLASSQKTCQKIMGNSKTAYDFLFVERRPYCKKLFETEPNYKETITNLLENIRDSIFNKIINIDDCYHILNQIVQDDYEILEYFLQPISINAGFVGDYYNLQVTYTTTKEQQLYFFVKQASQNLQVKEFAINLGILSKEYNFYMKIIPFFQRYGLDFMVQSAPKCYLFRLNSLSVFEDLNSEGFQMLDSRIPLDYTLVVATIKKIAKFHAATLVLEANVSKEIGSKFSLLDKFPKELATKEDVPDGIAKSFLKGLLSEIDYFLNDFENKEKLKEKVKEVFDNYHQFVVPSKKYKNVLCHGDLWINNIMYQLQDKSLPKIVFVDYQNYKYVPPVEDVLYFIYVSTNRSFRNKYFEELLVSYHQTLKETLDDYNLDVDEILTYEQFLESCSYYKKFAIVQSASASSCTMMTTSQLGEVYVANLDEILYEDKSNLIFKLCEEDDVYKERLEESVLELKEILLP